jgi:hypothetical protein
MLPAAPVMFSTITVWPSEDRMPSASMRANTSPGPPAANGMSMVTGCDGKSSAAAGTMPRDAPMAASDARRVRRVGMAFPRSEWRNPY